jgi:hypothetical protein
MPTQGDFWILVFIGLLIANLVLLFYVKQDFDRKVGGLSQEVKGVKESLFHVKQDSDKRMVELLQEVNSIKGTESEIVKQLTQVKSDFNKRITELLQR